VRDGGAGGCERGTVLGENEKEQSLKRGVDLVQIELTTAIAAPIERCFDLSRSIDLELASTEGQQQAIAGITSGLIGPGQEVTWSGRHSGFVFSHTSRITAYEFPRYFQDSMLQGAFKNYCHDHYFETFNRGVLIKDVVKFAAPCGFLGRLAKRLALERHMLGLLDCRNLYQAGCRERTAQEVCGWLTTFHEWASRPSPH
jgi:ligand-binding SRPBCC domain-containing protein